MTETALERKQRLQRVYDERRTVLPRFTPIQARNVHEYLSRIEFEEAAGRELGAALDELRRAIDEGAREQLFPGNTGNGAAA